MKGFNTFNWKKDRSRQAGGNLQKKSIVAWPTKETISSLSVNIFARRHISENSYEEKKLRKKPCSDFVLEGLSHIQSVQSSKILTVKFQLTFAATLLFTEYINIVIISFYQTNYIIL